MMPPVQAASLVQQKIFETQIEYNALRDNRKIISDAIYYFRIYKGRIEPQ